MVLNLYIIKNLLYLESLFDDPCTGGFLFFTETTTIAVTAKLFAYTN